ncbi:hypothetical protein D3C86_1919810 [compost metagenome]
MPKLAKANKARLTRPILYLPKLSNIGPTKNWLRPVLNMNTTRESCTAAVEIFRSSAMAGSDGK